MSVNRTNDELEASNPSITSVIVSDKQRQLSHFLDVLFQLEEVQDDVDKTRREENTGRDGWLFAELVIDASHYKSL